MYQFCWGIVNKVVLSYSKKVSSKKIGNIYGLLIPTEILSPYNNIEKIFSLLDRRKSRLVSNKNCNIAVEKYLICDRIFQFNF